MPRVLLGATGAISVVELPQYVSCLRAADLDVRVVMTRTACKILPKETLGHFCEVYSDGETDLTHVELARWADVFAITPCTANALGVLAMGLAPNLLSATVLAHEWPLVICPIMNLAMWNRAPVRRNVEVLRSDGHVIVQPVKDVIYEVASKSLQDGLRLLSAHELTHILGMTLKARSDIGSRRRPVTTTAE